MEFMVTFGQKYPRETHPTFPEAHRDGFVVIEADDMMQARRIAVKHLGRQWADLYERSVAEERLYPLGEIGRFTAMGKEQVR